MNQTNEIQIVYENDDFLAINKPAGISVQNEKNQSGILPQLRQQLGIEKLWLIHRLDKVTSGLLLLGKNKHSTARLSGYFAHKQITKFYLAITDKKPKKKQGTVAGDMRKIRDSKWALSATLSNPAVSQFFSTSLSPGLRLNLIKPLTGKTHQIRVMLKSLGSPILGDSLYTGTFSDRTYLHAYCLDFIDQSEPIRLQCMPISGERFTDSIFVKVTQKFAEPWEMPWPTIRLKQ